MSALKTVVVSAIAGALLGPFALWTFRQQHATRSLPPPAWFRDTVGGVCAGCGPKLTAGRGETVVGWRHPGDNETLAVGLGSAGNIDRYDLRGRRHAQAFAVAVGPDGDPALLVWDGRALELTRRDHHGWQQPRQLALLTAPPSQLALVFSGRVPVAGWLTAGQLSVFDGGRRRAVTSQGRVRAFQLQGGSRPVLVWQDRAGAASWSSGRTVRLGSASAPPQLSGRVVVWRDGSDVHLASITGNPQTIATGASGPVAVAAEGTTVLVAGQEQRMLVLRTITGRKVSVRQFALPPHTTVTAVQLAGDQNGAAVLVWQENNAMVKALARPAGKRWSARPSELTRRDETTTGLQAAGDGSGRFAVVWDNHGFVGETVELAEINLGR